MVELQALGPVGGGEQQRALASPVLPSSFGAPLPGGGVRNPVAASLILHGFHGLCRLVWLLGNGLQLVERKFLSE